MYFSEIFNNNNNIEKGLKCKTMYHWHFSQILWLPLFFSFRIPITLAKICFSRVVKNIVVLVGTTIKKAEFLIPS